MKTLYSAAIVSILLFVTNATADTSVRIEGTVICGIWATDSDRIITLTADTDKYVGNLLSVGKADQKVAQLYTFGTGRRGILAGHLFGSDIAVVPLRGPELMLDTKVLRFGLRDGAIAAKDAYDVAVPDQRFLRIQITARGLYGLFSAPGSSTILVQDIVKGKALIEAVPCEGNAMTSCSTLSSNSEYLLLGMDKQALSQYLLKCWSVNEMRVTWEISKPTGSIRSLCMAAARRVAVGTSDGIVDIVDVRTGKVITTCEPTNSMEGLPMPVRQVSMSLDESRLAVLYEDGTLSLFDIGDTARRVVTVRGDQFFRAIGLAPKGDYVAIGESRDDGCVVSVIEWK